MKKNSNSEGGVKTMRTNRIWSFLVLLGTVLLVAGTVLAKIPEPDNIIYGPLSDNGQPVISGEITLKINGSSAVTASYLPGSNASAVNAYILRVPMDSEDQRNPGVGRQGDVASIYLNDQLVAAVTLGPRGTVMKVPLQTCSGLTDFYPDADNDGYPGGPAVSLCVKPAGYKSLQELVSTALDCNDNDASIHSGTAFYRDADGDGLGNPQIAVFSCSLPAGYVSDSSDCNDNDASIHAGITFYRDADGDGYGNALVTIFSCNAPSGYVSDNTDCNDNNAFFHPDAVEICDGKDNNCDGSVDNQCVGDSGKMCRNGHYLKSKDWIINAYTVREVTGLYTVYLAVVSAAGGTPSETIGGMTANPLQIADDATVSDITLVFDEADSAAYIIYTAVGQVLKRIPLVIQ